MNANTNANNTTDITFIIQDYSSGNKVTIAAKCTLPIGKALLSVMQRNMTKYSQFFIDDKLLDTSDYCKQLKELGINNNSIIIAK